MIFLAQTISDPKDACVIGILVGIILLSGFFLCIQAYRILHQDREITRKMERDRKLEKIYKNRRNKY